MACDQIEAKIKKYHTLSGMSAVSFVGRFCYLQDQIEFFDITKTTENRSSVVLIAVFYNMHASYLLCSGSAVRTVKLQAQFRLHFYDLCGFTLNLDQP